MAGFKDNALERRNASLAAKQALLEKFKSQPNPDENPELQQRFAERRAIEAARDVRAAERKVAREIEAARLAEIKAAEELARMEREEEEQRLLVEQAKLAESLKNEKKLARDARYAARKTRVLRGGR